MTYFEFTKRFPDETSAINFIVSVKYKDGYVCPKCGCLHRIYHQHYDHRKLYCNNCKTEWSALVGTIFENTHLDLRMWLYAINLCMIARKGISALQLQRELGMGCYQSSWRMLHLIRKCMGNEKYKDTFEAVVEIDETYVGGKHTNGIESCWAVLKRSVYGIFHHVSVKHLQQYVDEFCFRLNNRDCDAAFLKCVGLAVA